MMMGFATISVIWTRGHLANGSKQLWKQTIMWSVGMARTAMVLLDTYQRLEEESRRSVAKELLKEFDGVEEAICSRESDTSRIKAAISGKEEEVNEAVHVLVEAGSYTVKLVTWHRANFNIRGLGIQDYGMRAIGGSILWLITAILVAERGFAKWPATATLWISVIATTVGFGSFIFMLALTVRQRFRPLRSDEGQFVVWVWSSCSVVVMLITALALGVAHPVDKDDREKSAFSINRFSNKHPPPTPVVDGILLCCPLFVVLAIILTTVVGPDTVTSHCPTADAADEFCERVHQLEGSSSSDGSDEIILSVSSSSDGNEE
jgi:hypothetical protein